MTRAEIIANNNFEIAKEKFENASLRWSNYWWEACEKIYNASKEWAEKYILDPVKRIIKRIKRVLGGIDWNGFEPFPHGVQQFYLIRLLNAEGENVWNKIGTTSRATYIRMKDHLKNADYRQHGVKTIQVIGLWDCKNVDAEIIENRVRKYLRKDYEQQFVPNDRFEMEFDIPSLSKMVEDTIAFENSFMYT